MYGRRASEWYASAPQVLAICMRLNIPSYIRAPPLVEMMITGSFFFVPASIRRVSFSPTTDPIEPPRNEKSMMPSATRCGPIRHKPVITASFSPVLFWYRSSLDGYEATPVNSRTSTLRMPASVSLNDLSSTSDASRARAAIGK